MNEFRNLGGKRVCDVSKDNKYAVIVQKGYITRISANADSTLKIENIPRPPDRR